MELFVHARTVRLRSSLNKYLTAGKDEESVFQSKNGTVKNAFWTVELIDEEFISLRSCYGKYLTASNKPFMPGVRGRNLNVVQSMPNKMNSSIQWEPISPDGGSDFQVHLKTRYGNFLQSNGGPPPWRNSVTHDPKKSGMPKKILWHVDVMEMPVLESESNSLVGKLVSYVEGICYEVQKRAESLRGSSKGKESRRGSTKGKHSRKGSDKDKIDTF